MALFGDTDYSMPGYVCAMRDAHRKPAQAIVPPAITWHLGFNKDAEFGSSDEEWIERVELLIIEIFCELVEQDIHVNDELHAQRTYRAAQSGGASIGARPEGIGRVFISNLCNSPVSARHGNAGWSLPDPLRLLRHAYRIDSNNIKRDAPLEPEGSRYETVVLEAHWQTLEMHMRIEIFDEYFTITTSISLRTVGKSPFCMAFDNILDTIEDAGNVGRLKEKLSRLDVAVLYETVWNQFSREIFSKPFARVDHSRYSGAMENNLSVLRLLREKPIGREVFADFRGIVFEFAETADPPWSRYRRAIGHPGAERGTPHEAWLNAESAALDGAYARQRADEMLSVLYAAQPRDDIFPPPFEATEYTFSTLNKKRCLFGTSFGWPQSQTAQPLLYVLLFSHDNYREIGLTVNVLHLLGTLRLSALRDFDKIISRNNLLERVDQEYQQLRKTLLHYSSDLKSSQHRAAIAASSCVQDLVEMIKLTPYGEIFQEGVGRSQEDYVKFFKEQIGFTFELRQYSDFNVSIEQWHRYQKENNTLLDRLFNECKTLQNTINERLDALSQRQPANWRERYALKSLLVKCSALLRWIDVLFYCTTPKDYREKMVAQMEFALASLDDRVKRGVSFRAEQAQLNMHRFVSLQATLDIADIVGFQPYDRFVKQRLERSFNLILSMGARYQRLSEKVQKLRNELDEENRMNKLVKLQIGAEIITIAIIAPYYLSHFLDSLASELVPELPDKERMHSVVLVSYSFGILVLLARLFHERHGPQRGVKWYERIWHRFGPDRNSN